MLVIVAAMALLIAYETNPGFQSWLNYRLLHVREHLRYWRESVSYNLRHRHGD